MRCYICNTFIFDSDPYYIFNENREYPTEPIGSTEPFKDIIYCSLLCTIKKEPDIIENFELNISDDD